MRKITLSAAVGIGLVVGGIGLSAMNVFAAAAIPWQQPTSAATYITPTNVNGRPMGITVNGTSTLATTTTTILNGTMHVNYLTGTPTAIANTINNAIANCSTMGSTTCNKVELPTGNYTVTANIINLKSGISVCGEGEGTKITEDTFASFRTVENHIFTGTNLNNLTICKMFLSNAINQPIGSIALDSKSRAIYIPSGVNTNIQFDDLRFEQWQAGIDTNHLYGARFNNLRDFSGTILGNLDQDTGSRDVINAHDLATSTITNLNVSAVDTAVRLQQVSNVSVTNSLIYGSSIEIGNEGTGPSRHVLIEGNKLYQGASINLITFSHAATIELENGLRTGVDDIRITGNTIEMGNSQNLKDTSGIFAGCSSHVATSSVSNIEVIGNTFYDLTDPNVHTPTDALQIGYGSEANPCVQYRWKISDNTIYNINGGAIRGHSLQASVIDNNYIYNFNQSGNSDERKSAISLMGWETASTSDVHVFDNYIDGNYVAGTCAFYLDTPSVIGSGGIEIGPNQVNNASTTLCYAGASFTLNNTTFQNGLSVNNNTATSTFGGHVGINTQNYSTPYPLTILGGNPIFSMNFHGAFNDMAPGTTSIPNINSPMSIAFYAKPTAAQSGGSGDPISLAPDISFTSLLSLRYSSTFSKWIVMSSSSDTLITSTHSFGLNEWHEIVYTYDGVTATLYVDGVNEGSSIAAHSGGAPNIFKIGSNQGRNYFTGILDQVRIWDRALTSTEVSDMLDNYNTTPRNDLQGEWLFDEGQGSIAYDTSGNGNNASVVNGETYDTDVAPEVQPSSVAFDITALGNSTSSLRSYTNGQLDAGWFNATISTSTFRGINLPYGGCFAINAICLSFGFATSAADYWKSQNNFFSTSSANYYVANTNLFSTTSTNFFLNASTTVAKTYTSNYFSTSTLQSFPYASSTYMTALTASTSLLFVDGLTTCNGASNALTWSAGTFGCNTISATPSGSAPFTFGALTFSTSTAATTTSIWSKGVFFASSTVAASQFPYASSTAISVISTSTFAAGLGVGTTIPFASLNVRSGTSGAAATSGTVQPTTARLEGNDNGVLDFGAHGGGGGAWWMQAHNKTDFSSNFQLYINPNGGNVGIGNTNANSAKLVVTGASGGTSAFFTDAVNSSFQIKHVSGSLLTFLDGGGNTWLTQNTTNGVNISAGKLGIGTSTPGLAFSVQGNQFIAGNITSTSSRASVFPYASSTAISTDNSAFLATLSGKVSVGTSSPAAKLSLHANNGDTNNVLFLIGSSTQAATTTHFSVLNDGTIYAPNTATSAAAQTGYWCYDANGQLIRDTTTCLVSALKFKTDIHNMDDSQALSAVLQMQPVTYFKKEPLGIDDAGRQVGFIADYSADIVPELITHDSQGEIHGFNYEQYTAYLTGAIRAQQKEIEALGGGVKQTTRSIEENYQWLIIMLLVGYIIYNEYDKRK